MFMKSKHPFWLFHADESKSNIFIIQILSLFLYTNLA